MGFYKTFKSHTYTSLNLLFSIVYGYCFNTSNGCQFIVAIGGHGSQTNHDEKSSGWWCKQF